MHFEIATVRLNTGGGSECETTLQPREPSHIKYEHRVNNMKKTFAARRVPRKIGQNNDGQDDDESPTAAATEVGPQAGEPFLHSHTAALF